MNLEATYAAVLGAQARRGPFDWGVADPESARLAVRFAVQARTALSPGYPRPGCVGLHPPAGMQTLWADELVARVGAGTTVAEFESALHRHRLSLGVEVAHPEQETLGACYAAGRAGFAGPRGYRLRDRCVGLSFVDGRARILAAGSRVVKNVAGYDYGRLHHAARGSLGLVLDLTVRLIARPQVRVAMWWSCDREDLPRRLPELRASWGQDAVAELLVDRVAAVRFGLPGPGIIVRHFGDEELIAPRVARSNAVDVSARWESLLGRASMSARPMSASELSIADPGEDWVAELGTGLLRQADDAAEPPTLAGPSAAAVAVKRVFDPHGIWPALPGAGDAP